jgi:hypothetical protein
VILRPVSLLVMVTLALGTTAPDASVTVPWIPPVEGVDCALRGEASARRSRIPSTVSSAEYLLIGLAGRRIVHLLFRGKSPAGDI